MSDEAQPLPPGVRVRGGRGGTRARLEDLARAAAVLEQASAALDEVADAAAALTGAVDAAAAWSPSTAPTARAGATAVRATGRRQADRAAGLGSDLRQTAAVYAGAELDVAAVLRHVVVAGGRALGEAGPTMWAVSALGGLVLGLGAARTLVAVRTLRYAPGPVGVLGAVISGGGAAVARAPGPVGALGAMVGGPGLLPSTARLPSARLVELAVPGVAGFVTGALPGRALPVPDPVPAAAGALADGGALATAVLRTSPTGLLVTPTGPPTRTAPPRTSAEVLGQVELRYPAAGGEPGSVGITRIDRPDGTRSWVVAIPGTQVGSPLAGSNPMDMATNLALVAGRPEDASELVARSMAAAGIAPGEPVLLAGHSQGGMVAMDVAADPALRHRFAVAAVLTAGSPVGGMDLPAGTVALHLEHSQDLLHGVDGTANPPSPQRTTVERDLAVSPLAADREAAGSVGGAHTLPTYIRTARALQGCDDPSVRGFEEALGAVLGPAASTATTSVYQGTRIVG